MTDSRSRSMPTRLAFVLATMIGVCLASAEAHALDLTRSINQFHHTAWSLRDGMPAYVNAFAQTPDGYLWIGAASGLYRFDGIHLEPFEQKLPGGAVLTLAVTPSGDLWIGSSSGVSRLSQGRLTTFDVPGLGRPSGIRHIALGHNGEVWVATDKVARFDGRKWQVMDSDWGSSELYRKPGGVWGLAVARDGVVWTKNLLGLYFLRPIRRASSEPMPTPAASSTSRKASTADCGLRTLLPNASMPFQTSALQARLRRRRRSARPCPRACWGACHSIATELSGARTR